MIVYLGQPFSKKKQNKSLEFNSFAKRIMMLPGVMQSSTRQNKRRQFKTTWITCVTVNRTKGSYTEARSLMLVIWMTVTKHFRRETPGHCSIATTGIKMWLKRNVTGRIYIYSFLLFRVVLCEHFAGRVVTVSPHWSENQRMSYTDPLCIPWLHSLRSWGTPSALRWRE